MPNFFLDVPAIPVKKDLEVLLPANCWFLLMVFSKAAKAEPIFLLLALCIASLYGVCRDGEERLSRHNKTSVVVLVVVGS